MMPTKDYLPTTWYDPRAGIGTSSIQGNGMFAAEPIYEGDIVVVIGGIVLTNAQFQEFITTVSRYNAVQIGEDAHLVDLPTAPGGMNHSCDSNLWMRDEVTVVARWAIAPGEELTLDYALTTVEPHWQLDQPCQCGTTVCRYTIRGNDWQLPDVQQRYQGHFAPFINERIRLLNGM